MGFVIVGSAEPKYLAATDILIGDMSNINYEFLLYNRPIILLANKWVRKYFPDIGIKSDIDTLEASIMRSINDQGEYEEQRSYWQKISLSLPEGGASKKYIDIALEWSKFRNPTFVLLDGNNAVRRTNLSPLIAEIRKRGFDVVLVGKISEHIDRNLETIFIAAHYEDLFKIDYGYSIHIDHDLKAPATANLAEAIKVYKKNNYFDNIDLHITTGYAGDFRTKYILGENKDRTQIGGYPKADDLLTLKDTDVKIQVCREVGFNPDMPLITYAPAGTKKFMKPGGSLSKEVIKKLEHIAKNNDNINILVKVKYDKTMTYKSHLIDKLKEIYSSYRTMVYTDGGGEWKKLIDEMLASYSNKLSK